MQFPVPWAVPDMIYYSHPELKKRPWRQQLLITPGDYIVISVYYYATILLYLPLLHRPKLLIISSYQYIIMPISTMPTTSLRAPSVQEVK